jgi:hypothetical protein
VLQNLGQLLQNLELQLVGARRGRLSPDYQTMSLSPVKESDTGRENVCSVLSEKLMNRRDGTEAARVLRRVKRRNDRLSRYTLLRLTNKSRNDRIADLRSPTR